MSKQSTKKKKRQVKQPISSKKRLNPQKKPSYPFKMPQKKMVKIKRRKLRFGRVFMVFLALVSLYFIGVQIWKIPIRTIFVSGNTILTDQQVIELAHLENYPTYLGTWKGKVVTLLKENVYIKDATVKKKGFREFYIKIEENIPLFYDASKEKTILKDGTEVEERFTVPTLLNYVPDTLYELLKEKVELLDKSVYVRISEMKYDPNEVDDKRFSLTMNDGNMVYVTLKTFEKLNSYVNILKEIVAKYENKKGTLYLDEGEYFKVREEN